MIKFKKKLYFLIESDSLYAHPKKDVRGRIIEVVVANEQPCILMQKNKVIAFGGELYSLKVKMVKEKKPKSLKRKVI